MIKYVKHFFNPYIKVKKSKIHNVGVYAKKDIKKNTKIIEYLGKKITHDEYDKLYEKMLDEYKKNPNKKAAVYTFTLDDDYVLDGGVWWNLAKYFNHSCNPNCEAFSDEDGTIEVYAKRDIKKGEELLYNYGYDIENYEDHPCHCGSKDCVGYIVDEEQWPQLKKILSKNSKKKTT